MWEDLDGSEKEQSSSGVVGVHQEKHGEEWNFEVYVEKASGAETAEILIFWLLCEHVFPSSDSIVLTISEMFFPSVYKDAICFLWWLAR